MKFSDQKQVRDYCSWELSGRDRGSTLDDVGYGASNRRCVKVSRQKTP